MATASIADGTTIEILLEHGAQAPDIAPVADLVAQFLKEIGLKVTVKQIDPNPVGREVGRQRDPGDRDVEP